MARDRDPNRDLAFEMYKDHNGEILIKDIAAQLGKGEGTVRGWKTKDEWDFLLFGERSEKQKNAPKSTERSDKSKSKKTNVTKVTNNKEKKRPKGIKKKKKREWNRNPKNQFTSRNNFGVTHGLYTKYMNAEQLAIIEEMGTMNISDHLWYQIQVSFSAIVRAQRIMWVDNKDDHTREVKKEGDSGTEYEISFSHEKFDSYIKAQARAMSEYRSLVKKFIELADEEDERRLKLEGMTLNIEKSKLEIARLKEGNDPSDNKLQIEFVKREGSVPNDERSAPIDDGTNEIGFVKEGDADAE